MRFFTLPSMVLVLVLALGCGAGAIAEYPEDRQLTAEQIKEALLGDDFRQKNHARGQLEKLKPAERLSLLKDLLAEGDAPTRMLAVAELSELPSETYTPILGKVAKDDPDPEIRELAFMIISPDEDEEEGEGE